MACIDGARRLTPGILRLALAARRDFADPLVATLSWHLGPKVQNESMLEGYDQTIEDRLLESVDWRADGYSLFRIGCLAQSSRAGWLGPSGESNCVAMRRAAWERLAGLPPDKMLGSRVTALDRCRRVGPSGASRCLC